MPQPESLGPEGSSPKQSAGLHGDELLEKVAEAMKSAPASDDWLSEAEAAVAAVRGAVPSEPQEERLTREEAEEIVGAIDFLLRYSDGLDLTDYQGRILAKLRVFSGENG